MPYGLNHSIQDRSIPMVEEGVTYELSATLTPVVPIRSIPVTALSSVDFTNGCTIEIDVKDDIYSYFKIPCIQNSITTTTASSSSQDDSYGKLVMLLHHSDDPELRNLLVHEQLVAYYNNNLDHLIDECKVDMRSGSTIYTSDTYHDRIDPDVGLRKNHHDHNNKHKTSALSETIPTIYLSPDVAYPTQQCYLQKVYMSILMTPL